MSQPQDFDGFILPNGDLISIEDADAMLKFLIGRTENLAEIVEGLWLLAGECAGAGHFAACCRYYEKIFALVDSPGEIVRILLAIGQARNQLL
jgi:hypothetical protein